MSAPPGAYVVCTPERAALLPGLRRGRSIEVIDPRRVSSERFIDALDALLAGGARELPRWALYDCAETTGAVVGYLDGAGVPVSMLAATPTAAEGGWHFFALRAHDTGMSARVVSLAAEIIRPGFCTAVLSYRGRMFDAYTRLGRASLISAWTPAHSEAASATIRVRPGDNRGGETGAERVAIDTRNEEALRGLQLDIEHGARCEISAGPNENGILTVEKTDAGANRAR